MGEIAKGVRSIAYTIDDQDMSMMLNDLALFISKLDYSDYTESLNEFKKKWLEPKERCIANLTLSEKHFDKIRKDIRERLEEWIKENELEERFYRFPHLKKFDGLDEKQYNADILEEAVEAFNTTGSDRVIEIMDVMQACETALRNSGFTEEELFDLMVLHNTKDADRGYTE